MYSAQKTELKMFPDKSSTSSVKEPKPGCSWFPTSAELKDVARKRSNDSPKAHEKRPKLQDARPTIHKIDSTESGLGKSFITEIEYDAFADSFDSPKSDKSDELSSSLFNTQTLNQIESLMAQNKFKSIDDNRNLMESFNERIKLQMDKSEAARKKSSLHKGDKINDEYREEMEQLFDDIELSICTMGRSDIGTKVDDTLLNSIFNNDVDKKENNIFEIENLSFGSIIKQALINNIAKPLKQRKCMNSTINMTLTEGINEFKPLGPYYGLPLRVKELIKQYKGIEELYDWQDECLRLPAIESRKNLIYALPTSGGKTLVAEILIFREVLCYRRNVIFVLPYVSIVQEKVWSLSPFGVGLDFLIEEYASSKGSYPPRKRRRKNSVYIATIEKALGLINSLIENGRITEVGLVVIDELHLIGEESRGPTLEAFLTKVMFLKANIHIIGMSATIGNLPDIQKFLKAEVYSKNFRPVELLEYVKCGSEIARINWNYTNEHDLLVESKKVKYKYSASLEKLDPDMLGGLVMDVIPKDSCLIFCPSKKNCENVTHLLCKLCKPELKNYMKTEKDQVINALKDETGDLCDILRTSVQYGIAYHHSGLTSEERKIIEEGFRAGIICVICCTSTLAAGVNLPAKRVILRAPLIGRDFLNLARYKQMVGRAGRAGLGEAGDSILITKPEELGKVKELLMSPMDCAMSGMHSMEGIGLRHLVLSCINLGIANTRKQLLEVASQTLLAVQSEALNVDVSKLTDKVIKSLFKLGALKESCGKRKKENSDRSVNVTVKMEGSFSENSMNVMNTIEKKKKVFLCNSTKLVVSELGCAAIKGGLELSKAHLLYEDLYQAQSTLNLKGHLHLLYLVTPYNTAEQVKPDMQIYYDVITKLDQNDAKVAKMVGINESVAVKMLSNNVIKNVPERILNRFYVTLMLYDLWNGMPVFEVSQKYQINRGIVQNLMMMSATFASNVVSFCEELEEFWVYAYLLNGMSQRLSHCCVKELSPLMELPAVKQNRAKQLYNAGYKTLQSIAKASVNDLVESIEFMSRGVANQLIAASKMLLLEKVENLREEAEDVLEGVQNTKSRM